MGSFSFLFVFLHGKLHLIGRVYVVVTLNFISAVVCAAVKIGTMIVGYCLLKTIVHYVLGTIAFLEIFLNRFKKEKIKIKFSYKRKLLEEFLLS